MIYVKYFTKGGNAQNNRTRTEISGRLNKIDNLDDSIGISCA